MKKSIRNFFFAFVLMISSFTSARSQDLIDFSYDWLDTNFFQSIHGTILGDWFSSPTVMDCTGVFPNGEPMLRPRNSVGIGLASFVYEPRMNIYNHYDYISVSVSAPVTVSFSAVVGETNGIGHLHVPLMFDANFFGQSVYNSYDEKGFSIGVGTRYTFAPLIPFEGSGEFAKRHWLSPLMRLGYRWENYGDRQMVNVSFGFSKIYRYKQYDNSSGLPDQYDTRKSFSRLCLLVTLGRMID